MRKRLWHWISPSSVLTKYLPRKNRSWYWIRSSDCTNLSRIGISDLQTDGTATFDWKDSKEIVILDNVREAWRNLLPSKSFIICMICRIRNPTYEIGETCLGKPDMPPFALQKNSGIPINRDTTIKTSGMDGCWCAPRTSNPPAGTNTIRGEFDSHPFPLLKIKRLRRSGVTSCGF